MEKKTIAWHHLESGEVLSMLKSNPAKGLDSKHIPRLQEKYGRNQLSKKKGDSLILLVLSQFNQPLVYILIVAAIGIGLLHELVETGHSVVYIR